MKTDRLIKYAIWGLLIGIVIIILALLNISYDASKLVASRPDEKIYTEGVGMLAFLVFYFTIYQIVFIFWLVILFSNRSNIRILWKNIQLILIAIVSILPTIVFVVLLLIQSPNPFKQYPLRKIERVLPDVENTSYSDSSRTNQR
ncbi:MAG: hypothetical protein KAG64_07925 [Bacteroidales bacterium]|nr:hypothetical protein [Bacteroidales bacterium]